MTEQMRFVPDGRSGARVRKPQVTLVAFDQDGGTHEVRTAAGYDWAGLVQLAGSASHPAGWYLVAKGWSYNSVHSRTRSEYMHDALAGGYQTVRFWRKGSEGYTRELGKVTAALRDRLAVSAPVPCACWSCDGQCGGTQHPDSCGAIGRDSDGRPVCDACTAKADVFDTDRAGARVSNDGEHVVLATDVFSGRPHRVRLTPHSARRLAALLTEQAGQVPQS